MEFKKWYDPSLKISKLKNEDILDSKSFLRVNAKILYKDIKTDIALIISNINKKSLKFVKKLLYGTIIFVKSEIVSK